MNFSGAGHLLGKPSVSVICIGSATAGRKYMNYKIAQSIDRGNGILGLRIHHLKDPNVGTSPEG